MVKRRNKSDIHSSAEPTDKGLKPLAYPHADMPIWECPNCGQHYFGGHPPDTCDYCQDFTTWRPIKPADPEPDANP